MNDYELLRIIDLLDKVRLPFLTRIDGAEPDPYWNIVSALVRAHLTGRPTTISTLAHQSGAPYATGLRKIAAMEKRGQILRKARGSTGKSFTLHPSPALLDAFIAHAGEVKVLMARTIGQRAGKENESEYYFGGSAYGADVVLPPRLAQRRAGSPEVRFLLNDDNYFQAMRNIWCDIRNNLGSRSSFDLRLLPELHAEAERSLGQRAPAHDVIGLNMPWLGSFADAGQLRPLDDLIAQSSIQAADFHQSVWQTGSWRGRQYGIPIYCTAEALLARRDLFEERDLTYPRRLTETLALAKALHRPDKDMYGISWNGARGMPIASTFMFLLSCCGNPVISTRGGRSLASGLDGRDDLAVNVDTDAGRTVLDHLQALVACSPPDVLTADWDDALDTFLTGRAAMAYAWTMRAARCEYDLRSAVRRKVAYLPHPAGPGGRTVTPLGGFVLTVPAGLSEERAELAFAAIEWMASHDAMKEHVRNGLPVAPRFFVSPDPEAAASTPIVHFVEQVARRNQLHAWPRPNLPQYRAIESVIGIEVHRALSGETSHAVALRAIQAELEAIIERPILERSGR